MKLPKLIRRSGYYTLDEIKKYRAQYNLIISERSNGKTYAALEEMLKRYVQSGIEGVYIRRWAEDIKGSRGQTLFNNLIVNGVIDRLTNGTWNGVSYYARKWYLSRTVIDDKGNEKTEKADQPFCHGLALSEMEHDKSTSFPRVGTVVFDEVIARTYLKDEFILFMNTVSTIVRNRDDVVIYMLGNTISHYCIYFAEMGLKHMKRMNQGTIDLYEYGESDLKVAVEYCLPMDREKKKSNKYFAFDNPKLKMITQGEFELELYPHAPCKWVPNDIVFSYFIVYDDELFQADIIATADTTFTFIHRKTSELKDLDHDLIFSTEISPRMNIRRRIDRPQDKLGQKIYNFFLTDNVFYQDNEVGESVTSFITSGR